MQLSLDGLVLAGGESRRMGQPKALLPLTGGETLLQRALSTLRQASSGTIWISRPHGYPAQYPEDLPDALPRRGPLSGLAAGLSHSATPLLLVLAVDLPNVPSDLFHTLYQHWIAHPEADIVYPAIPGGDRQPLAALWHQRALPVLQKALALSSSPRIMAIIDQMRSEEVPVGEPAWLMNLNTPDDLRRWRQSEDRG